MEAVWSPAGVARTHAATYRRTQRAQTSRHRGAVLHLSALFHATEGRKQLNGTRHKRLWEPRHRFSQDPNKRVVFGLCDRESATRTAAEQTPLVQRS